MKSLFVHKHPSSEVAAAVRNQLEFAEQERQAAASVTREVFAAPDNSLAGYGEPQVAATQLLDSYSLGQDLSGYGRL